MTHNPRIWSHNARVTFYGMLLDRFGQWNANDWSVTGQRAMRCDGKEITATEFGGILNEIYEEICAMHTATGEVFAGETLPKSYQAVQQQMQFCLTVQPEMTKPALQMQRRNRLAAYEAGFLSMSQILFLEQVADTRRTLKQ